MAETTREIIELWPAGAPLAEGNTAEDRPAVTPYLVSGRGKGAVIVCPGGGYRMRAEHEGEPIALWLNSLGISAFVLRYRVAPYRYPSALMDVQRAIRLVRSRGEEWAVDSGKIGVLGFSAGGHLASAAGTHYDLGILDAADPIDRYSCRPDLMVLCYPVISMKQPYKHEGSLFNLLGPEPEEAMVDLLSSELQVTGDTPPAFLWHTADDGAVPVGNSLEMAAALSRSGVSFDLHIYEQGRHGMGLAEEDDHVASWSAVCGLWLQRYGFATI